MKRRCGVVNKAVRGRSSISDYQISHSTKPEQMSAETKCTNEKGVGEEKKKNEGDILRGGCSACELRFLLSLKASRLETKGPHTLKDEICHLS